MSQTNANINLCGVYNLLKALENQGFTKSEIKKIADRIANSLGANIVLYF